MFIFRFCVELHAGPVDRVANYMHEFAGKDLSEQSFPRIDREFHNKVAFVR